MRRAVRSAPLTGDRLPMERALGFEAVREHPRPLGVGEIGMLVEVLLQDLVSELLLRPGAPSGTRVLHLPAARRQLDDDLAVPHDHPYCSPG